MNNTNEERDRLTLSPETVFGTVNQAVAAQFLPWGPQLKSRLRLEVARKLLVDPAPSPQGSLTLEMSGLLQLMSSVSEWADPGRAQQGAGG